MCLDHLSAYAICAKMILAHIPYALREDSKIDSFLSHLCGAGQNYPDVLRPDVSWPDILWTGRFMAGHFVDKSFRF